MLVRLFPAYVSLINLDGAAQHSLRVVACRMANALKHVPCRLLGDADVLRKLNARDSFGMTSIKPDRCKPLGQEFDRTVGKDGAGDQPEGSATLSALVSATVAEVIDALVPAAVRAIGPVSPPHCPKVLQAGVYGGEPLCELNKTVHDDPLSDEFTLSQENRIVKYIAT